MVDVSIIVPCFNREYFVEAVVGSCLACAKSADVEIIVIDDGSADNTWSKIQTFGSAIKGIRTTNRGVSAARNAGIDAARGRYVRFVDSDDLICADTFQTHFAAAERADERCIVVGDAASIDEEGTVNSSSGYGYAHLPAGQLSREQLIRYVMSPALPMFPVEALRSVGGFNPAIGLGEDYELAMRLIRAGYFFTRIPLVVYYVREHGRGRLSRGYGPEGYRKQLAFFEHVWGDWLRHGSDQLTPRERAALGKVIWVHGRNASRDRLPGEASRLFDLARRIGGRDAEEGGALIKLLYNFAPAYRAELLMEASKRLAQPLLRRR